jgi:hypothetical protein
MHLFRARETVDLIIMQLGLHRSNDGSHLVLHFDINETILIGDDAGGDTSEDCLNKILAKSAFVRIPGGPPYNYDRTESVEPTEWWDGTPILEKYSNEAKPPPLVTEWEWPLGCCPYYRTKLKTRAKSFVSHQGSIYRELYDQIKEKLNDDRRESSIVALLPALFTTIVALSESSSHCFTIVFRTMGSDLSDVAKAINAFVTGNHPAYPDFRNERLVIGPEQLVQGRWRKESDGNTVYELFQDDEVVASGDNQVLEFLHSNSVCGIQDDYPFWKKHNHEPWAGKPIWISSDRSYHHLLFDDNIHNLEHDSIASIRFQTPDGTFATLTSRDILQQHGVHLVRVPAVEPILYPHWFLDMISVARERYLHSL